MFNLTRLGRLDGFLFVVCLNAVIIDSVPQKSLGEEVNELTSSRLLKLERENQALLKRVEDLRGAAGQDSITQLAKLIQENQKLNNKVSSWHPELFSVL